MPVNIHESQPEKAPSEAITTPPLPAKPKWGRNTMRFQASSGTYYLLCGFDFSRRLGLKQVNPAQRLLFDLLEEARPLSEIIEAIQHRFPQLKAEQVQKLLLQLHERGFLEDAAQPISASLSSEELARYDRQFVFFSEFERAHARGRERYAYQEALKSARVALLGLGGIGSWICYTLAATGVGFIRGVDGDVVELTNLNRQVLYTPADIGRQKTDAAASLLPSINPFVTFELSTRHLQSVDDIVEVIKDCTFVVLTADRPYGLIRRWTNEACCKLGIPFLQTSTIAMGIGIGPLVIPGQTPCLECQERVTAQSDPFYEARLQHFAQHPRRIAPSLGALCEIAGGAAGLEAVKYLAGMDCVAIQGAMQYLNTTTMETTTFPLKRHPDCQCCATAEALLSSESVPPHLTGNR